MHSEFTISRYVWRGVPWCVSFDTRVGEIMSLMARSWAPRRDSKNPLDLCVAHVFDGVANRRSSAVLVPEKQWSREPSSTRDRVL